MDGTRADAANADAVKATVRQYISENFMFGSGSVALSDSDSFLDHHVLDSTGFLELIGFLEETYSIKVGDAEMIPENLDSLDNIAAYLARKLGTS
jgi:acyl carrier protein